LRQKFIKLIHKQKDLFVRTGLILIFVYQRHDIQSLEELIEKSCILSELCRGDRSFVKFFKSPSLPEGLIVSQQTVNRRNTVFVVFSERNKPIFGFFQLIDCLIARFDPSQD
jgi:hypothetical protein